MAKIDLVYPKIPGSKDAPPGARCIAFEKLDGTNLHWAWDAEYGWISFGTRRDSFYLDRSGIPDFHAAHPGLEEAPERFQATLAAPLEAIIRASFPAARKIFAFTEFLGPNSFAGRHKKGDAKSLVLFDVQAETGMLAPAEFVERFGSVAIPRVVYQGKLTGRFADDVREGKYGVAEGVVCKGDDWMVKIKTHAYMERLKQAFKDNWEEYWE